MLTLAPTVRIFLAPGATDMRNSFDGLAAAAKQVIRKDPLSGHVFVLCNRRVELPTGIVGIAGGSSQACAIDSSGRVFGWGLNSRGQLADGTLENRFSPVECQVPPLRELFVRYGTVHAITKDGRRIAWGSNRTRLVGDDATGDLKDDRPYPVEVIAR